jgi:hypothetical protein
MSDHDFLRQAYVLKHFQLVPTSGFAGYYCSSLIIHQSSCMRARMKSQEPVVVRLVFAPGQTAQEVSHRHSTTSMISSAQPEW